MASALMATGPRLAAGMFYLMVAEVLLRTFGHRICVSSNALPEVCELVAKEAARFFGHVDIQEVDVQHLAKALENVALLRKVVGSILVHYDPLSTDTERRVPSEEVDALTMAAIGACLVARGLAHLGPGN